MEKLLFAIVLSKISENKLVLYKLIGFKHTQYIILNVDALSISQNVKTKQNWKMALAKETIWLNKGQR